MQRPGISRVVIQSHLSLNKIVAKMRVYWELSKIDFNIVI